LKLNGINKELSARNVTSGLVRVSSMGDQESLEVGSREDYLGEISSLNNATEIYHQ
jgi:hypothetical protein